ncbi:MAG: methyl-accepting chemotaxis protein [Nitrospirota bacterium]|nr:methyl-accepting chemotaxis protein [Nitrospirota bacterium]
MKQFFLDMKISHKLILCGIALLVPAVINLYLLVGDKNKAITFAEKEVIGVSYLGPMKGLLEKVPQHRGLSYGFLNGETDFKDKISRISSEIDEAIREVDAMDAKYGTVLNTTNEWSTVKREWATLESNNFGMNAEDNFKAHTKLMNDLILFMQHVLDKSNLILDPDLATYYLMDSAFLKVPSLTEHIGRLRGTGAGIMARGEMLPHEKTVLLLTEGGSEALAEGLAIGITAARTANSDLSGVQGMGKEAISKLHQFEKRLESFIETGEFGDDPGHFFDEGTEVITAFFNFYDEASTQLTRLLVLRVNVLKNTRQSVVGGAVIFITLGLVVGFFTIRSISAPLREMTDLVQKVAKGDLDVVLDVSSKDEVGVLGLGFSEMLQGLKEAAAMKGKMDQVSAMVENAQANFIFADTDYNITYMNPASSAELAKIAHLLPCAVNDIVGKSIDIFHKNPSAVRRILDNPSNLPHSATVHLGDEIIEITAIAIFDHARARMGTMANWGIVTEKFKLKSSLKETTVSVASASEELATASREMQANAEQTTAQAQNVASISNQTDQNVQSVAAAAEEMSVTVKEISKNVHNANQITEQAVEMAESMNETIIKLDASNSEIGNVVKVISMIAGQTNLLALNATIEAARAGDAGKGFAVVANEVKELAKGTSKATDEIRSQIVAIQSNTKGAIESIEKITEIIKENNSITTSIASAVEEQSMTTNEISLNMAEAAKETKQVVEELEEIISTSQNTAASAVNIGEASEELSRTASNLSGMTEEE